MVDMRGKDRGYTLLEMLLVLILLSGAGFVLLIKLPVNFEQQRLAFATTQLLGEIRDVRQAALAENNWYEVKFFVQNGDNYIKIYRQATKVKEVHFKDGVQFVGKPSDFKFNDSGRSEGKTIVLTNASGQQKSVVIAPVGMRIREK